MRIAPAFLLLAATISGCLSFGIDEGTDFEQLASDVEARAASVLIQEHDHFDAGLHAGSAHVRLVGYGNGVDGSGDPDRIPSAVVYNEFVVTDRYAYVSRASVPVNLAGAPAPCAEVPDPQQAERTGGFVILNIQDDPARPFPVGEYNGPGGSDIEVDEDGDYVFFSAQRNCPTEVLGVLAESESPDAVLVRGIHIVDVSDPTNPVRVGFQPLPWNGPHTITYFQAEDGAEYLSAQTYDLVLGPEGEIITTLPGTQELIVFQLVRAPAVSAPSLVPVARYQITQNSDDKLFIPHDAIPQRHPVDGGWYLYVAYWDKGVQILDLEPLLDLESPEATDRPQLESIGQWTEFSPSSRNNIHQVRSFDELIAGRHITVAEPEIISADETGVITFLDTTDPRRIQRAGSPGYWRLPGDLVTGAAAAFDFSPHNFDLWDGKVALAHNHGGVWIIDVSTQANLDHPKSAGYFLSVQQRTNAPTLQPWFWGVYENHGLLYAVDVSSGLYVLEFTGP